MCEYTDAYVCKGMHVNGAALFENARKVLISYIHAYTYIYIAETLTKPKRIRTKGVAR